MCHARRVPTRRASASPCRHRIQPPPCGTSSSWSTAGNKGSALRLSGSTIQASPLAITRMRSQPVQTRARSRPPIPGRKFPTHAPSATRNSTTLPSRPRFPQPTGNDFAAGPCAGSPRSSWKSAGMADGCRVRGIKPSRYRRRPPQSLYLQTGVDAGSTRIDTASRTRVQAAQRRQCAEQPKPFETLYVDPRGGGIVRATAPVPAQRTSACHRAKPGSCHPPRRERTPAPGAAPLARPTLHPKRPPRACWSGPAQPPRGRRGLVPDLGVPVDRHREHRGEHQPEHPERGLAS